MRVCILDSNTKICVAAVMLDYPEQWIPVSGQEVANNHDGGIGMQLTENGWISIDPLPTMTWDMIRESRNYMLMNCDWTVIPDSPLTTEKKQQWINYRQALRDITEIFSDPNNVVWPTEPSSQDAAKRMADLNRVQFMFMVRKLDLEQAIPAAIDSLPETTEQEINTKLLAKTLWIDGQVFERDHPMFSLLSPLLNITDQQLDQIWLEATQV